MSNNTPNSEKGLKRKRDSLELKALDKSYLKDSDGSDDRENNGNDDDAAQARILLLENSIFESKKNYNNIAILMKIFESDDETEQTLTIVAISLFRIFSRLMVSGNMINRQNTSEKEAVVIKWLKALYSKYKKRLNFLLGKGCSETTILILCMRLLKIEGQSLRVGEQYSFPTSFLTEIVQSLLSIQCDRNIRDQFCKDFMEEYDDIRFYTLEAIAKLKSTKTIGESNTTNFDSCFQLLASIESPPNSSEDLNNFYLLEPKKTIHALYSVSQHKKRAQSAWLALMQFDMSKKQRKSILKLMSTTVAPWFTKPEILMDFLTDSYDTGGSVSLLALSGVFYLIQERNLDYPQFYNKLYSLLDAGILHSKHRSKFFRLLSIFLGSTHLPVVLVASFIKRLSRLTLNAPPAGIVTVIPWIYNLLKKHPQCTFMIHRETRDPVVKGMIDNEGMSDPFLHSEQDPMETKAIESCLWEIVVLQSHYHPNVATLAKIISEQFTKHSYNIEDFLDHSYSSMLEAEIHKEVKKAPVVEFEIPTNIFTESDIELTSKNNLITKLWNFS
ncbi:Nucleolar complex protein 4 [Erysiphe neolycopersici]|uniref:Nucleolar complex protein 4 n=1 Tax=Erysiphe neolycopersici TaxID=212602 RepID=A0A420I059_9PEZI|nr:Nucleolar complex protein 4 [Erysiphe neolycopersici]